METFEAIYGRRALNTTSPHRQRNSQAHGSSGSVANFIQHSKLAVRVGTG